MSDQEQEAVAELPPAGGTTIPARGPAPDTDALSVRQAVEQYEVSERTLRRKLAEHREGGDTLPGAFEVNGTKGTEWRIPRGTLDAAGFVRRSGVQPTAPAASGPDEVLRALALVESTLATVNARLDDELQHRERAQLQLEAAQEDRGRAERERQEAELRAARMEVELRAERERAQEYAQAVDVLRAELDERRRPWWRRRR